jgi:hypothetical protein
MDKWTSLNMNEKVNILRKKHVNGDMSIKRIAEEYGTYPNKVLRDAKKFGIKVDSKAEAQKKALKAGVAKHPTEGTERPIEVKQKIAKKRHENWENLSESERKKEVKKLRQMYKDQKVKMHESPNKALKLREAAQKGSKLELYVFRAVIDRYGAAIHQREDAIGTETFHIDIFLEPNIAIEIDGPAHFEAIWGEDKLESTQNKDFRKHAACLAKGYYFVSVINDRKFSINYGDRVLEQLFPILDKIIAGKRKGKKILCRV